MSVGGEEPAGDDRARCTPSTSPTGRWRRLPDLPTPRHGLGVVAVGTRVYAIGGGHAARPHGQRRQRAHRPRVKVHVISDIEGVAGIVKWEQTGGDGPLYQEARKLYTEEINAAVRGAKQAGATEIVVMDCHGAPGPFKFNSLVAEDLDPACEFVVQEHWTGYTAFLEQGCDAALFVGMHARAGTPEGVLNHTVSGSEWRTLTFNGVEVGETGINAALCGHWGCPVCSSPANRVTCDEGRALLGDGLTTVAVKEGTGRFGARNLAPKRARELIEEGARNALRDLEARCPRTIPGGRARSESSSTTATASTNPLEAGVEIVGPREIVSRADDWWSAWQQFFF